MPAPKPISLAFDFLLIWFGFFAGWTVVSTPLTLAGAPFPSLWAALATGLAASLFALRLRGPLASTLLSPAAFPPSLSMPDARERAVWGSGILILIASGVYFIPSSNAVPLWAATLSLAIAALLRSPKPSGAEPLPPDAVRPAGVALALLAFGICTLYVVILRPDADDSFYLNLPIGLKSADHGMMVWDTLYGVEGWPLLGSNYRVEAMPTLTAAISWLTGLPVPTVAHFLLPTIWCLVWAATLAVIGHGLFGAYWWIFALFSVLTSMALAGTLQSWGVHGVARLFHGKGPLLLTVVPLIVYVTLRADSVRLRLGLSGAALGGMQLAALGLTANAIYLAPLALGLSLAAGWIARRGADWRRLLLAAAAAPPVAAGLWLLVFDKPISVQSAPRRETADLALWAMGGTKLSIVIIVSLAAAAALAARIAPRARCVSAYLVVALLLVFNPFLWSLYDRFVTGGLNFRLWWAVPGPMFLAALLTWAVIRTNWLWVGIPSLAAALVALALAPSGLLGMSGTRLAPSLTKLPPTEAAVADAVRAFAPVDRMVLAPEEIAAWLPTIEAHPPLVYTRRLYLAQSAPVIGPDRIATRRLLADWIAGDVVAPASEIVEAMQTLRVGLIVLPDSNVPSGASAILQHLNARPVSSVGGYTIYAP